MGLRERLQREGYLVPTLSIYTSVLPRAIETAQILAAPLGEDAVIHQDCDLCTWHIPCERDGLTWEEYRQRWAVSNGGVFLPFEQGAESWAELVVRVGRGLWKIAQKHQGKTALVVVHTETINASLIALGQLPLMLPLEVTVGNCSLTEWTTAGDPSAWPYPRWTLVRFNDTGHFS